MPFVVKGFQTYALTFTMRLCRYDLSHGNVIKGFWAL
jgi:hypothetical protein